MVDTRHLLILAVSSPFPLLSSHCVGWDHKGDEGDLNLSEPGLLQRNPLISFYFTTLQTSSLFASHEFSTLCQSSRDHFLKRARRTLSNPHMSPSSDTFASLSNYIRGPIKRKDLRIAPVPSSM